MAYEVSGKAHAATKLKLLPAGALPKFVRQCEKMTPRPTLAFDVPIGLPKTAGWRACDKKARERLGLRRACVFPVPDRELLGLTFDQARAKVLQRRARNLAGTHPIMTKQAIAISPKIDAVDRLMRAKPCRQRWIVEVHPEICFLILARMLGDPIGNKGLSRKSRGPGRKERNDLLVHAFPDIADNYPKCGWLRREVGLSDILDAYVALWSAHRYAKDPRSVCELGGDLDAYGLPRRMIA